MSTFTIRPSIKAQIVIRFEDGTEQVLGDVRFTSDMEVRLDSPGKDVYFTGDETWDGERP